MDESELDYDAVLGCLLGTAIGDSLGLPYEGLSPARAARLLGPPDRHRLIFGRGMVSDDTEHSCMALQSMLAADGDLSRFQHELASRLRWWLASLPAGTGLATARAILKLWIGFGPRRSGVFSAGNGPAMRAPVLGIVAPLDRLREFVNASTQITHTDPKADWGAVAVAVAAQLAATKQSVSAGEFLTQLQAVLQNEPADEFIRLMETAGEQVPHHPTTASFAASIGLNRGVTGYTYHTVPVAIHCWLRHQRDYRAAVSDMILCGGDADSTAAIVGGIVGAGVGQQGIPQEWIGSLQDWPLSTKWIQNLAVSSTSQASVSSRTVPSLSFPSRLLRNLCFLPIVLGHGFRRLAPPY